MYTHNLSTHLVPDVAVQLGDVQLRHELYCWTDARGNDSVQGGATRYSYQVGKSLNKLTSAYTLQNTYTNSLTEALGPMDKHIT